MIDKSSLLVVVDNHKPSFTEAPELLDLTDKVVLIDHHREVLNSLRIHINLFRGLMLLQLVNWLQKYFIICQTRWG